MVLLAASGQWEYFNRAYHISGGNVMGLGNHLFHARKKKGLSWE